MGCTVRDLLDALPGAVGGARLRLDGSTAEIAIDGGRLNLAWGELPPRRIGLVTLPRLHVRFAFDGVDDAVRQRFMRHFDLYTQKGGG